MINPFTYFEHLGSSLAEIPIVFDNRLDGMLLAPMRRAYIDTLPPLVFGGRDGERFAREPVHVAEVTGIYTSVRFMGAVCAHHVAEAYRPEVPRWT